MNVVGEQAGRSPVVAIRHWEDEEQMVHHPLDGPPKVNGVQALGMVHQLV